MILYNAGYKLLPKTTYIRVQTKQWTTFAEQKKPFAWVTDPYVLAGNDLPNDFRRSVGFPEKDMKIEPDDKIWLDLGEDWEIQTKEYWLDKRGKQMFKLYNRPAIDDAINSGKQLRFSHDPRNYHDCALEWEWNYIKNKLNIDDADKALRLKMDGFWYVIK